MNLEKLANLIADHVGTDAAAITEDTTFESLGIDSLDTVEMIMQLEEELNVSLELDEKLETVGALLTFIQSKL